MAAEPPSLYAVLSRGRCGRGWGGSGGPRPGNFRIFKAPGCILGDFRPIWLPVLGPLNKAFAA